MGLHSKVECRNWNKSEAASRCQASPSPVNMLDVFSHVNAFMCLYYCRSLAKTRSTSVWDVMIPSFLVACLAGWKLRNPNPWNSMEHTMFRIVLSFKNAWSLFLYGTNNLRSAMGLNHAGHAAVTECHQ